LVRQMFSGTENPTQDWTKHSGELTILCKLHTTDAYD